jgi:hypothetical protein
MSSGTGNQGGNKRALKQEAKAGRKSQPLQKDEELKREESELDIDESGI